MSVTTPCLRCGTPAPGTARPSACPSCPPVACRDCGEPDDRSCSCWIDLSALAFADIKALFAGDDLSLDHEHDDTRGGAR